MKWQCHPIVVIGGPLAKIRGSVRSSLVSFWTSTFGVHPHDRC